MRQLIKKEELVFILEEAVMWEGLGMRLLLFYWLYNDSINLVICTIFYAIEQ